MLSLQRRRAGFTLIELLVVVVIIGILASVAMGNISSAQDKARNSAILSGTRSVFLGIESFKADNNGGMPQELVGPTPDKFLAADSEDGASNFTSKYVPGAMLPVTPWAQKPQFAVAAPYANGDGCVKLIKDKVDEGLPLDMSSGQLPDGSGEDNTAGPPPAGSGPSVRTHFGYFYYYGNQASGRYAVMGVGKAKKLSRVIGLKANYL